MDVLLSLAIGLGLAAACGFRIFLPFLAMSIAAKAGYLSLAGSFEWIGSTPALITFGVATVLEIAAYYVPWLDNLLDTAAAPIAVVAGIVVTASQVTDTHPLLGWSLAVIAGGGAAAVVQTGTTLARGFSSFATGGLTNPLVSTIEAGSSILLSLLAIIVPLVAAVAVVVLVFVAVLQIARRFGSPQPPALAEPAGTVSRP